MVETGGGKHRAWKFPRENCFIEGCRCRRRQGYSLACSNSFLVWTARSVEVEPTQASAGLSGEARRKLERLKPR